MEEHRIEGFDETTLQQDIQALTESDDSMVEEGAAAVLQSLLEAVENGCDLTIQGVDYLHESGVATLLNENRRLRYRLREANRNVGKQGQTIHVLRSELAEIRQLNSRIERGELRIADRNTHRLQVLLDVAREEISALYEKLAEQDSVNDHE